MYQAVVICDSEVPARTGGCRLTTLMLRYPRFIHAQFMTHRMFSRNASSSRAIPVKRMIDEVRRDPVFPLEFGTNQKGMVAGEGLRARDAELAEGIWQDALEAALRCAEQLSQLNVHKQVVNRLLEPFSTISVVVTATEWENFFALRLAHDTQPEMQQLARAIKTAMDNSSPQEIAVGGWHLPFVRAEEQHLPLETKQKVAVARCARVSYRAFDTGKDSAPEQDAELYTRLLQDKHMSPFEHVACAFGIGFFGNFRAWRSLRHYLEN